MERQAEYIIKDLCEKIAADVVAVIKRNQMLVDHPFDLAALSMIAAAHATGIALADLQVTRPDISADDLVDRFFDQAKASAKALMAEN